MNKTCESCGRNHDRLGAYCADCINDDGNLKAFEEVRENLSKHISETQGYAEVAAIKLADSILEGQPAWKKRFKRKNEAKIKQSKKRNMFRVTLSFLIGVLIATVSVSLIFSSIISKGTSLGQRELVQEDVLVGNLFVNKNYICYLKVAPDDETKIRFYKQDKRSKVVTPLSDPFVFDTMQILAKVDSCKINDDYFVWNFDDNIRVSDFNNPERIVFEQGETSHNIRKVKLLDNWVVFELCEQNGRIIVYAIDLREENPESFQVLNFKINPFHQSPWDYGDIWHLKKGVDGNESLVVYENYFTRSEDKIDMRYYLESGRSYCRNFEINARVYTGVVLARYGDKILFYEKHRDVSDIADPEAVNMILPTRSMLSLHDIKSKELEEIGIFTNFAPAINQSDNPDKLIFLSSHPGQKTIFTNDNPTKPFDIDDSQNKKCEYFVYEFESGKLSKFYESIEPPAGLSASNHRVIFNTRVHLPELKETFLYDFDSMKIEKISEGTFSPSLYDVAHTKDEIYFFDGFEWGSPMDLYRISE